MVKLSLYLAFFFVTAGLAGQEKILTDRPGETRSSELVKGNHLQVEMGFRKEKLKDQEYLYRHPSATIRYGLFNAIELRMDLASQTIQNKVNKQNKNGLLPLELGMKAKILPEYRGFPSVAILGIVGIPSTAANDYFNRRLPIEFRTLFGNTLSDKIRIQYNGGVKWEGEERKAEWMYSFSPLLEVSDRVNLFIEEYAFLKKAGAAEHYFDGGLEYYFRKNFMADLSAGVGLSKSSSPYFLSAGLSFRFPVR